MDDNAMMAMLHQDEEQWYTALIDRYTPYVTAIIGGMAKGSLAAADVEEVAADVFFKLWRKREGIRAESLKAYVAQVTRNASIDRLRRKGVELVPYQEDALPVADHDRPDDWSIVREQTQILEEAVRSFAQPGREIFIRYYYFGESIPQIAGRLQLNADATKTKLHRLRSKLRDIMRERGYGRE